jgi:cell shape-determining protein MreC
LPETIEKYARTRNLLPELNKELPEKNILLDRIEALSQEIKSSQMQL